MIVLETPTPQSDEEEKVYGYVATHENVSARDLQRMVLRGKSSDYVDERLKGLVTKGRLEEIVVKGKGRSSRVYTVR